MKKILSKLLVYSYMVAAMLGFVACDNELEVQQSYPFTIETMPIPKSVAKGETVEIRCELKREGVYEEEAYTIRFFLFEGQGSLRMDDVTFLPNDRYPLTNDSFRLYYTAKSDGAHNFVIYIENKVGQIQELTFDFTNDTDNEDV
ncbi:DUF3872 domain-containing protein [Bacteroides graminisolvens]|uniref:DUF3872 domain-containing protein n=1 Tax=Bacteroides graminisolvens TaxID=477666 RepID=UPI002409E217|nr:DUF3872 domain-containing protein [Bacteroides graminisolvens]